jgi:hypothetical protein
MVDTPVGKKCRPCAKNQTHLSESSPQQVLCALVGALVVSIALGYVAQPVRLMILAFPYGWLVGETAVRSSGRSRSLAVQVVAGVAALLGGMLGAALPHAEALMPMMQPGIVWARAIETYALIFTAIGTVTAVWKVRNL